MKRWIAFLLIFALLCPSAVCLTGLADSVVRVRIDDCDSAEGWPDNTLDTVQQQELFDRSYQTLLDRVDERGFAPTSLEGGSFTQYGMFTRDSFNQALAHIAKEDYDEARRILRYQLSYHVNTGYETIVRYVPDLQDKAYGNSFGNEEELSPLALLGGDCQATQQIAVKNDAILTGGGLSFLKRCCRRSPERLVLQGKGANKHPEIGSMN